MSAGVRSSNGTPLGLITTQPCSREIPCYGTTQADYFYNVIPVTAPLTREEIETDYERNTGMAIVRRFADLDASHMPAVLVNGHGPFTWGKSATKAAFNAVVLEEVARMAWMTVTLNPDAQGLPKAHMDRHFFRKHGPGATYGQGGSD